MNATDARTAIAAVLGEIAPDVDLQACRPGDPFADQADLDSMDVLSLLAGLAERTGIEIPDSALDPGWSLDDLVGVLVYLGATRDGG
jgi:acyl carrier protein